MEKQLNEPSNSIKKHIWIAIGILVSGILIGIASAIIFKSLEGIYGISSSIVLSFLAFSFSYFQFYQNKYESEIRDLENKKQIAERIEYDKVQARIRRSNDLKLATYKDIVNECNLLITKANDVLFVYINIFNNPNFKEGIKLKMNIPHNVFAFIKLINFYEDLLKISLGTTNYNRIAELIMTIIKSKDTTKMIFEEYYNQLNTLKFDFNKELHRLLIADNLNEDLNKN